LLAPDRLVLADGRELTVCFDETRVPRDWLRYLTFADRTLS
jgi:hypothetical protein